LTLSRSLPSPADHAAALLLGTREWVAGLYTNDTGVLILAAELMVFVALWQFVDDTQVTAIGALRGFKDTRVPLLIALLAYWIRCRSSCCAATITGSPTRVGIRCGGIIRAKCISAARTAA
jgi:Na+-driven multidrug efflux pump